MLSLQEIIDMAVMTLFVGFIFKDMFMRHPRHADPLDYYSARTRYEMQNFLHAVLATVPGIVLHELAHKFVALAYGLAATFHASYFWLVIGAVLKLLNFGLIFFVPGFVSISGSGSHLEFALIAFAGPGMNLLLWGISALLVKLNIVPKKYLHIAIMSKKINLFLFIFNLIPIPPFDGFSVFNNLYEAFF